MRKSIRFWLIYSVAWIALAASHFSLFFTHLGQSFFASFKGAVFNTVPTALFGVVVVMVCRRLPWSHDRRHVFLAVHLLLVSLYLVLWLVGPPFLDAIDQVIQNGKWELDLSGVRGGIFSGVMIYLSTVGIVYAVQTNERLSLEKARAERAESLRTRAELEALRAQLNPHFLFNTLHSLMALVRHDPAAAEDALERLALLLRHTLMTMKDPEDVQLSDELDFVENYLALEHLRLGDRLRIERNIRPESLECRLPPFTLQPLIENSIRHAISSQPQGGLLRINAERRNGFLSIELLDDGPGAEMKEVETSNGIGVKTVRQRLMTRYGDRASFQVNTAPGKGFSVRMKIPAS
ncbi:MAG TPA: histidine kinase [Pyrinomonadaceae bacterium]|jgi:hypothetical protein|nr:histidine kinase [Pyrinomonadaceae bacterium]